MTFTFPKTAYILAAGLGTRLKPVTDTIPKPLLCVAGQPILARIFDHLASAGIEKVFINIHAHADQMRAFLKQEKRFEIKIFYEPALLETGGSVAAALGDLQEECFFVLNGDAFWEEAPHTSLLHALAQKFDPKAMDCILALYPCVRMITPASGDYDFADDGRLIRNPAKTGTHMFMGVRIVHRNLLENKKEKHFSFLSLFDQAQERRRLFGLEHGGAWYHLTTPEDLVILNATLQRQG